MSNGLLNKSPVLISACLLGVACRYDGGSRSHAWLQEWARGGRAIACCPEQLGGLPTPRPAAAIEGGGGEAVHKGRARVISETGEDISVAFLRGAKESLKVARIHGCRMAVLKERSPSCGVHQLTVDGQPRPGRGVTATLLAREGLTILSEEDPQLPSKLQGVDETTA